MSMASMAHAMIKAGLVDEKTVKEQQVKEAEAGEEYEKLSDSIRACIHTKRTLRDLMDMFAATVAGRVDPARFFKRANDYVELAEINLMPKANQRMVREVIGREIDKLEAEIKPMLAKSRKMEADWNIERPGRKNNNGRQGSQRDKSHSGRA